MKPVWVTELPPPMNFGTYNHDRRDFVALLRTRPGHWAQYKPGRKHSVSASSVLQRDFPGTEARARKREDGGYDIYARWMGQ